MPFNVINLGLTIKVPTTKTKNWGAVVQNELFTPISSHDHTGSGKGKPIGANGIAANAVDDSKIRLRSGQWLRSRNSTDTGDINLIRENGAGGVEINATITQTVGVVYTNEPGAAPAGLIAGKTYMQPNYILGAAINYTLVSGAYMEIIGFMTVVGTLTVQGQVRVI